MHVALDARTIHPRFPGIGRYVTNLARSLPGCLEPADSLTLLTAVGSEFQRDPRERESWSQLQTTAEVFSVSQRWQIPRILKPLGVDVFHTPFTTIPLAFEAPQVLTLHDLIPVRLPSHVSWRARLLFPWLLRFGLRQNRRVIVPSEFARQDIVDWAPYLDPIIRVIPHAASQIFSQVTGEEISRVKDKFGLEDYVLTLASTRGHKNLDRLQAAYRGSSIAIPLVVAGAERPDPGVGSHQPSILNLGPIAEEDLPGLYGGARLFVFPSLYEGFGLPVLEALACGCAVVCAGNTSLPEVAGPAALYFDPYNVREMRECLQTVLEEPAKLAGLSKQARRRASRFNWRATAGATVDVYREALGESKPGPE